MSEPLALVTARLAPVESPVEIAYYEGVPDDSLLARTRVFVPTYSVDSGNLELMARMPQLEVCQLLTAGFEAALPHVPPGVILCNAAGVHDASTAELAVGLMLASLRGIDRAARDMTTGTWDHQRMQSLADRRVLIIGAGGIALAAARRLEAFEAEVHLMGRTPREGVHGPEHLDELLPTADIVLIAVPLHDSTRGLVDAEFLAAMPDGALLVNVSRGGVVDTGALVAATSSGRIRAALDVTDPEPLPAGHPLWSIPSALITPHVGGDTTAFEPRARAMVAAQLRRWHAGEPLSGVV